MPSLFVDRREPRKTIIEPLVKLTAGAADVVELGTGDFVIEDACGHLLAAERKEIKDLLHSMGSDRFRDQMSRVTTFDHQMLIVEGFWSIDGTKVSVLNASGSKWINTGWRGSNVQMLLMGWQVNHPDLLILHTANQTETVQTVNALWHRAQNGCLLTSLKNSRCP